MIVEMLLLGSFICLSGKNLIQFPKINADSVVDIWPSEDGYTSRSTKAILVGMKNGDSVTVLYDKYGHLSPGTITLSKSKKWFTTANPKWKYKKGNCGSFLCSLANGMCKCGDVVADSGYLFGDFSDGAQGGCKLYAEDPPKGKRQKSQQIKPDIILSEEEMTKRFLNDFNKTPHIE